MSGLDLPPEDRIRLARLLGMLGSRHAGEIANAGRLADRLVRDHGLTWHDVLAMPEPVQDWENPKDWTQAAQMVLQSGVATAWESTFCESVLDEWAGRDLTEKQHVTLKRVWLACRARAKRAAS